MKDARARGALRSPIFRFALRRKSPRSTSETIRRRAFQSVGEVRSDLTHGRPPFDVDGLLKNGAPNVAIGRQFAQSNLAIGVTGAKTKRIGLPCYTFSDTPGPAMNHGIRHNAGSRCYLSIASSVCWIADGGTRNRPE
jgi:hypothetical protein